MHAAQRRAVEQRLNYAFYTQIPQAQIFAFNPPAINGVGSFGGFQFELEDRGNVGLPKLMNTAYGIMGAAAKDPRLTNVFTQFRINSPQIKSNIDRNKAKVDRRLAATSSARWRSTSVRSTSTTSLPQPFVARLRPGRRAVSATASRRSSNLYVHSARRGHDGRAERRRRLRHRASATSATTSHRQRHDAALAR